MPGPGKTGSADRAVYVAHAGLAYRSGKESYHASTRDLGELAGCDKILNNVTRNLANVETV
jgi:hypothetical protein